MPAQIILKTRTKQPLLATRINWANPITRGLVHASVPGVFRGKSPNLASTNFSTLYGSASPLTTSRGVGANISGVASSRVSYQSPVTSGNMTLFCVAKLTTTGAACFLGVFNFGNAVAVGNYLSIEAGPVYGAVSTDSANWQIASGRAPVAGETVAIAGSFTASGGRTIYINGVAGNTNATARNPSGLNEINEGCYYGGTGAGYVSPLTGSVVLSLVFNRVLSAAEHKSLTENPWQVFAPETIPLFWTGITAQFLRPISDVSNSGWTPSSGSDLFPMIGETTRNDTTYISATEAGAWCEVLLGTSGGDPLSSVNHLPRIVMSAGSGGIIVRLKQGATLIKEWTYSSLTGTDTLYEPTLTGGEIDSITDYTDLRLYLETTA